MYHKYGNHISKQDHQNNSGQDTGKPIDNHIPRSGINSGIVGCYEKLCQIINIEGKIILDHIIGFLLQFPHAIPQFLTSVCDLAHCIRILDDPVPEILQIRQGVFCFLQGIP